MRVYVSLVAFVVRAPDLVEQSIPRPRAARLRSQQLKNLKLKRRQIDGLPFERDLVPPLVYDQLAVFDALLVALAVLRGEGAY